QDGDHVVEALRGLNLTVEKGEFTAIMGPSGSGKTTLLNLIGGMDTPTGGKVVVSGQEVSSMSKTERSDLRRDHIGFIFQSYNLIPVLTAYENVEVPLLLLRMSKQDRQTRVATALAAVGLTDRAHHLPRQLSGGQQQRAAIARAIVADPVVMFADEPTGNLDREAATATMALLRRLVEEFGKTLVMVTHDPQAASKADRIVNLDKGQIVEQQHAAAQAKGNGDDHA
ncbi:MAG TPA: ABC transporter ATP-binding protein, partial [Planctomycetes bacterium]|nr:ABC transporter ATP-binding protein [Planctomycetota bacterium]